MRIRVTTILAIAIVCLAPVASWADLAPYDQDFESLVQPDPGALGADGWLVFGNVFGYDGGYWYGYGPFPAPNPGGGFSALVPAPGDPNVGGAEQGAQQLSVYSDYNNGDHAYAWIESNVFQEQIVGAADVGTTWLFKFDALRGNIERETTAKAFFKTLDPAAGYALTNFIWVDMTNVPDTWGSYSLSIFIDASLPGQILQFGFLNTATRWEGSGIFYDNVEFLRSVDLDVKPGSCPNPINRKSRGVLPVAVLGSGSLDVNDIDVDSLQLEGVAPLNKGYEDVATPFGGDLCGCTELGPDGYEDLTLKFRTQDIVDAIVAAGGDTVLTLTGTLLDGTPIEGEDCVFFVSGGIGSGPPTVQIEMPSGTSMSGTESGTFSDDPSSPF